MNSLIIGTGEIGNALANVLKEKYKDVWTYDIKDGDFPVFDDIDLLHICIPYTERFIDTVCSYRDWCGAKNVIIHSSVPVGTTEKIDGSVFHSPVRGKHPNMEEGLKAYVKYISCDPQNSSKILEIARYFEDAGMKIRTIMPTKATELLKLLALSRYGVYIAFAKEQEAICNHFGLNYHTVVSECERTRNDGLHTIDKEDLCQPILYPFSNYVGGHCTVEDMELLLSQVETSCKVETPLLRAAHNIDRNTKIWGNSNVYPTAKIGKGCSVGQFCEIGENVVIGNNVRIGAFTFIPEGVVIEDDVFVAPKCTFSNDKHPPSSKEHWGKITVKKGATIGMGSIILPGVTIGEGSVIGAGSVVTKDVGTNEVWYGQAAYCHGTKENIYK